MQISQNCLNLIKKWESCKLQCYQDIKGVWTIGFGETGPNIVKGLIWTQQQADNNLIHTANNFCSNILSLIKVPINQNQLDALVCLVYNIGVHAFSGSNILKHINKQEWQQAADSFLSWDHANGVVIPGLLNRRKAERQLFLLPA